MDDWTDVAATTDFPAGTRRTVDAGGTRVAVFNVDGEYYAIEDLCSHEAEALSGGTVNGLEVTCPAHQARFSLVDGAPLCAPAYEPIATFPVRIAGGIVQVRDDRFDDN